MIVAFLPLMWVAICADIHRDGLRRMSRTLRARVRHVRVLLIAVLVIALFGNQPRYGSLAALPIYLSAYGVLYGWTAFHAGKVAGVPLVALGVGSNFAVMLANGGMPVFTRSGDVGLATVVHHAATRGTAPLWWLGDIIHVPGQLLGGWYSIGDAMVLAGVGVVVWCASRAPRSEPVMVS